MLSSKAYAKYRLEHIYALMDEKEMVKKTLKEAKVEVKVKSLSKKIAKALRRANR